jgi:DNA-binding CsgD family transcriptional regulator
VEPDEAVAELLDAAAARSRARGDAGGAVTALTRAAQLSTDRHARVRRLLAAAYYGAEITGDLNIASQLIEDATRAEPQLVGSLPAAVAAANLLLNADCDVDTAHRLLTAAISAYPHRDDPWDETLADALQSLVMICWAGGRPELWAPVVDQLARLKPHPPLVLELCARSLGDPVRQAAAGLSRLDELVEQLGDWQDPIAITRVGAASAYTDRLGGCRSALQRVAEEGRQGPGVAVAINALVSGCVDDWQRGHWDEALAGAADGLTLSRQYGYNRYSFVLSGYLQTLVAAARGERDHSLAAARQMVDWARPRGAGVAVAFAHHIEIMAAQAVGDFESVYEAATAISPAGVLPGYAPHALWVLLDLVEAAVRTDRQAEAEAHVAAMEAAGLARISPRLEMVTRACSAIVARGPVALDPYAAALAVPGADQWRFDYARIQLAYGEQLVQARAVAEAREQLLAGLATFDELGAQAWTERARQALEATGIRQARDGVTWVVALTPQELEVADLAASGLTNKQIGRALFLSPRTVGARLYQLFPKLGITSRAALRDALSDLERNEQSS